MMHCDSSDCGIAVRHSESDGYFGFLKATSTWFSCSLSRSPKVCFNALPVSTTHVLALDRRPAIMARRSQVAVLLRR